MLLQSLEQPKLSYLIPSSQVSPRTTSPSPQIGVQIEGEANVHVHPSSIRQLELQPSSFYKFLSSHCSSTDLIPSPHKEEQIDHEFKLPGVQVQPGKGPVQVVLQP